jgi:hypothetical protein
MKPVGGDELKYRESYGNDYACIAETHNSNLELIYHTVCVQILFENYVSPYTLRDIPSLTTRKHLGMLR